jgi:hypothetical protein
MGPSAGSIVGGTTGKGLDPQETKLDNPSYTRLIRDWDVEEFDEEE